MLNFRKKTNKINVLDLLIDKNPFRMSESERAEMTISCKDCDYIPKVDNAGETIDLDRKKYQVMFNGVLVRLGGYHGKWMQNIIRQLRGHHEPQEEKVFYEILKTLDSDSNMIELGSFWSYYSIWFNKQINKATNIACEPDPSNMALGKENASVNNSDITFYNTAAGSNNGAKIEFALDSNPNKKIISEIRTVDSLVDQHNLKQLDILHMDVQGAELDALKGSLKTIKSGKLRYLFVSTHHYIVSRDPLTHLKCIDFIKENDGYIITDHSVLESYSGDGLIVASFLKKDKGFKVETSINKSYNSLFRPYEEDLDILLKYKLYES